MMFVGVTMKVVMVVIMISVLIVVVVWFRFWSEDVPFISVVGFSSNIRQRRKRMMVTTATLIYGNILIVN